MKLKQLLSLALVLILLVGALPVVAFASTPGESMSNPLPVKYETTYKHGWPITTDYIYHFIQFEVDDYGIVAFAFDLPTGPDGKRFDLTVEIYEASSTSDVFACTTDQALLVDGVPVLYFPLAPGTYLANLTPNYYRYAYDYTGYYEAEYALAFVPANNFEVEPNTSSDDADVLTPGINLYGFCCDKSEDRWYYYSPSTFTGKLYVSPAEVVCNWEYSLEFINSYREGQDLILKNIKKDENGDTYFPITMTPGENYIRLFPNVGTQTMYCLRFEPPQALKFTKQPKNTTVYKGDTISVSATATGKNVKYQWLFRNAGSTEYSLSSITTNTYKMTMTPERNGRKIVCVATDAYGQVVASDEVTITMVNAFAITQQPANVTVRAGKNAVVTVKAQGAGLKYQWYYAEKGSSTFKKSSITSSTYSVSMTDAKDGRRVYCIITDSRGKTLKTNTATISLAKLKITQQPKDAVAPEGQQVKTTLTATGEGLTYAWYIKNKGTTTWGKSSVTGNSYYVTMKDSVNGRQVYCVVTDKHGNSVKSNTVTLSMSASAQTPLKITKQPTNASAADGTQVKTTLTASGDGLKYTWYFRNAGVTAWSKSSLTGNSYYVTMKANTKGRQVYCVVTDQYGNSVKSNVVTLSMSTAAQTPLEITKQPTDVSAPIGSRISTTVEATGDGLTYTWYVQNAGQTTWGKSSLTGNEYYVSAMKESINGRKVYCVITDKYGASVTTDTITLTVE